MGRTKKVLTGDVTRQSAEDAFAQFSTAQAKSNQLSAKMDVDITKIRDKYQSDLTKLKEEKEKHFDILLSYAENNREEFGTKKSLEFTHGVIGFRTSPPKLKPKKGFTWAAVLGLMKEFAPKYIRTKEEPNKDALLADREEAEKLLSKLGVQVIQDEAFFVDPKQELVDA